MIDAIAITAFLTPFLPFLVKFGEKSAEVAGSKFGEEAWNQAKKVWEKLHPKVEAKEEAKVAAAQVAAKPESEPRQAVLREELETLLQENPDLLAAIAQIMQSESPATGGTKIVQTITNNEGQAINNMNNSKAIGKIEGGVQGSVNF